MQLLEEFREFEEEARAFAAEHIAPHAALIDREERIPEHVIEDIAQAGFLASGFPEKLGGPAGSTDDPVAAAIRHGLLHEALGAASASVQGLVNVHHMGGSAIALGDFRAEAAVGAQADVGESSGWPGNYGAECRQQRGGSRNEGDARRDGLSAQRREAVDHLRPAGRRVCAACRLRSRPGDFYRAAIDSGAFDRAHHRRARMSRLHAGQAASGRLPPVC